MKLYLQIIFFLLVSFAAHAQADTIQKVVKGRKNSVQEAKKPYVILISADGFRYDYAEKYQAVHLLQLAGKGVKAAYMVPSFPSVTFPNHYTIVTGMYPAHHGLVDNRFYDRARDSSYNYTNKINAGDGTWYGGTPLWVLAEQHKMLSASFYWVGSEAAIKNTRPTYYYVYNEKINIHDRIRAVVDWLKLPPESRPHLITFYFPQPDHSGHQYGPESPEVQQQVHFIDSAVYELTKAVKATGLNVNYVFVSDHGMTKIDREHPIPKPAAIDTSKFIISGDGVLVQLFAKNPQYINQTYGRLKAEAKNYHVYLNINIPANLHYGKADDRHKRIGDILLIPDWPEVFNINGYKTGVGTHGYDPFTVKEMMATFYAWGPAFKKHLTIPAFGNVDVYPVICKILGLRYAEKIDGSKKIANEVLK